MAVSDARFYVRYELSIDQTPETDEPLPSTIYRYLDVVLYWADSEIRRIIRGIRQVSTFEVPPWPTEVDVAPTVAEFFQAPQSPYPPYTWA